MKFMSKFDAVGFVSNIVAVILGIVITFSIQGIIDNKEQNKNIDSALRLVRDELDGCRNDIMMCAAYMDKERTAADYLQKNCKDLKSCPEDSVAEYGMTYISEMILTLPDDALELLKTSSLFPSIGDNRLSLDIIRAYDQCNALCQVFNRHEELKSEILAKLYDEKGLDNAINAEGNISISEIINTKSGRNLTAILCNQNGNMVRQGIQDIDKAIAEIDAYLADR